MTDHPGRKRPLACCVCTNPAGRWQQWGNRDAGYGICRICVEWVASRGDTPAQIRDYYGIEGVHYAPAEPVARAGGTVAAPC